MNWKLLILAIILAIMTPGKGQEPEGIFPFNYRLVELENGFKAYLIITTTPNQIANVLIVRTGSRDEWEPGRSGFAHFFEHMMFRGTKRYPLYKQVISEMGAANNASTSNDRTQYFTVAPSEYLEQIMDLESDRFMNLSYSESDFRTEAGAVLGEYQQGALTPSRFLDERIRDTAYDVHTYKHTTIGFEADVRAMPEGYEYSLSFYQRYYRPENVVLVLVGDFDFDEAERLIHRYYDTWERGYVAPQITPEPAHTAPRQITISYPGQTLPVLSVNYQGPAWSATNRTAIATQILGRVAFGSNSDLYKKLVIDERRVESLSAGFNLSRDPGLLSITARIFNLDDVGPVEREIYNTVTSFQEELVDEELFKATKSNMKFSFLMGLETAQAVAFSMGTFISNTGGIEAVNEYYHTLDTVTLEDIREAARSYLIDSSRTVGIMIQEEGS